MSTRGIRKKKSGELCSTGPRQMKQENGYCDGDASCVLHEVSLKKCWFWETTEPPHPPPNLLGYLHEVKVWQPPPRYACRNEGGGPLWRCREM